MKIGVRKNKMTTNILKKIKSLKDEKSPDEIEAMLLKGKLGEIGIRLSGYQCIGNLLVSHLVIEIHEPGTIEWMKSHPNAKVVHHIDGNPLNNIYSNLRMIEWSEHSRMHRTDPRFAEAEKARIKAVSKSLIAYNTNPANVEAKEARGKAYSNWHKDEANAKAIVAKNKAISKAKIAYYADSKNDKDIKARNKAISKTLRKSWLPLKTFTNPFMASEYAEASNIHIGTAKHRIGILFKEGQITYEKMLVDERWCNIYRSLQ